MAATTRLQLLIDIADELGDCVRLVASGTGATDTFISTGDMLYADGALNGREAWYTGTGTNGGTRRIVIGTDEDDSSITVSPDWATAPVANDVVVLVNSKGTGVTIPEIHRKINQLIRRVAREMADEVADTPAEFDLSSPILTIPTTWDGFLGVQIERHPNLVGVWDALPGKPYTLDLWDSPKTVTIKASHRGLCHGKRLRLVGLTDLAELDDDTDTTHAPASWLAKTAAFELLEAAALRSGDVATAFTYGELVKAQAAEMKAYVGRRFGLGPRIDLRQA